MRICFAFLFFIISCSNASCQSSKGLSIQYVQIKDSILIKEIVSTIAIEVNGSDPEHLFRKGLGYIYVNIYSFLKSDTIGSYYISTSFHILRPTSTDDEYPAFYTYVNDRLVLLDNNYLTENVLRPNYSAKSKRKLRKKIEPFLEKTTDATFYDSDNRVAFRDKKFRVERFRFDSGKYVFVLRNGTYKVVMENKIK